MDNAQEAIENALQLIKNAGFRMTVQRRAIVTYLVSNRVHPTAEQIFDGIRVSRPEMSLATVYNTLELLTTTKLIIAIDSKFDGKRHYDFFGTPHYHVICNNCGKIVDAFDFDVTPIPESAHNESGFLIQYVSLEAHGLCRDCQKLLGIYQ